MRSPICRHQNEQLDLFHETRQSPTWGTLSAEVRERTMALLALTAFHDVMKVEALLPRVEEAHHDFCGFKVRLLRPWPT